MEPNHLRHFFEVAKAGSFTEAARRVRISQSALSKSVALVEGVHGVRLLERSKRGVSLTPLGKQIFAKCEQMFLLLNDIDQTCKGIQQTCEGPLMMGASDHIANYLLIDPMAKLCELHPKVRPSVFVGTPHEIVELIRKNQIEIGLFFTRVNVSGLRYEVLKEVPMAVVCHPRLKASSRLRTLLLQAGFIGSIQSHYQHHPSRAMLKALNLSARPATILESNSQEMQKRFCLAGHGVAYLARFMVEQELLDGKLVELAMPKPMMYQLFVAHRKEQGLSLKAQKLVELIR